MATTQVDATLLVEEEGGARRPLSVDDVKTARTGAATETTLAAVLAELGGKLEPGDLAALATAARQDAAKNVLDAISQALGAPAVDTVLSLLGAIRTNTGTETTTVSHLSLTADQVQLNTDTVEALLGRLPAGGAASEATLASVLGSVDGLEGLLAGTLTTSPTTAGDVAGTLTDGRKTVTTPGTAVALRATLTCKWVAVTALTTNTQQVNVGGVGVLAASGTSTGTPLAAGQSVTIPVNDAAKVFVDARVAGEGVSFTVGS